MLHWRLFEVWKYKKKSNMHAGKITMKWIPIRSNQPDLPEYRHDLQYNDNDNDDDDDADDYDDPEWGEWIKGKVEKANQRLIGGVVPRGVV